MIKDNSKIMYSTHDITNDDIKSVINVLKNKLITQGNVIEDFEKKIAKYVGAKYAVAVTSATAGLHIACKALNFQEKDILLTSVISFVSSANVAYFLGGKTEFIDIKDKTVQICLEDLEKKIKKFKPKIIMPVHMGGCSYNFKEIHKIAKKYGVNVIEDAAHSFGGNYNKTMKIGSCKFSDMTVFSFHPVKTITTGEGGVVTTNDKNLYRKLLRLRSHGINKLDDKFIEKKEAYTGNKKNQWYYEMRELGYHYRITDIQCALGLSQLNRVDQIIRKKKNIFKLYDKYLSNLPNIKLLQQEKRNFTSCHLYIVHFDFKKIKKSRQQLMEFLQKNKIFTQVHYIPIVLHPFYRNKKNNIINFLNAKRYYNGCLSLPVFYKLSQKKQKFVIDKIKNFLVN